MTTKSLDARALDALADAIKRAAEALRKSQQVTFGDLESGEFFRFDIEAPGAVWQKRPSGSIRCISRPGIDGKGCTAAPHAPVIRLRATFVPEGGGQ